MTVSSEAGWDTTANTWQPWPGHVETADIIGEHTALTVEQAQRRDALYAAGTVLERRGPMGAVTPAGVSDILRLANFVIDGGDAG